MASGTNAWLLKWLGDGDLVMSSEARSLGTSRDDFEYRFLSLMVGRQYKEKNLNMLSAGL
jgi:hypothetical protein